MNYNRVSAKLGPLRSQPSGLRSEQMNFMKACEYAFGHRQGVRVATKRKHGGGAREVRERRTGGPSGRTLKHDVVFVPDNTLVAAQANPRGAVDPLIPLRNRGERGAPQPEAHHLEHPRQAQAEAEVRIGPNTIRQLQLGAMWTTLCGTIHRCTDAQRPCRFQDARQAGEHTPSYNAYAHNSRAEQAQHSEPHRTQGRHAPNSDTPHCPKRIHLLPPGTSTSFM